MDKSPKLTANASPDGSVVMWVTVSRFLIMRAVPSLVVLMLQFGVNPGISVICCETSCNKIMSRSYSLMNASSIATRVGDEKPFMLRDAIFSTSISSWRGWDVGIGCVNEMCNSTAWMLWSYSVSFQVIGRQFFPATVSFYGSCQSRSISDASVSPDSCIRFL